MSHEDADYLYDNPDANVSATFRPDIQARISHKIRALMDADREAAEAASERRAKSWWLAESFDTPGYYCRISPRKFGKLHELEELGTHDVHQAMPFATRFGCEAFCRENPVPLWRPVEHFFE